MDAYGMCWNYNKPFPLSSSSFSLSLSAFHFLLLHLPATSIPLHSLFLSSLHLFRQRQIRFETGSSRACLSVMTRDPKLAGRSEDEVGTWKVSGAVSHALRPEGQHFKRDDPQTSLPMRPNSHFLNCWVQEPPPPPKPRASGSPLTAVYPKLAWGELRFCNPHAMSQDFLPRQVPLESWIHQWPKVIFHCWFSPVYHSSKQALLGSCVQWIIRTRNWNEFSTGPLQMNRVQKNMPTVPFTLKWGPTPNFIPVDWMVVPGHTDVDSQKRHRFLAAHGRIHRVRWVPYQTWVDGPILVTRTIADPSGLADMETRNLTLRPCPCNISKQP